MSDQSTKVERTRQDFHNRLERVKERKQPKPSRPPRTGFGCLAPFLAIWITTLALVGLATFLPPLSDYNPVIEALAEEDTAYTRLHSENRVYEKAGLRLEVLPNDPGQEFDVLAETGCPDAPALPRYAVPQGEILHIMTQGTPPNRIGVHRLLPETAGLLDLYGWYTGTNSWRFIPAQMNSDTTALVTDLAILPHCLTLVQVEPPVAVMSLSLRPGEILEANVAGSVDRLYIRGMQPTIEGTLLGVLPDGVTSDQGYSIFPVISNQLEAAIVDRATISRVLQNPDTREAHAVQVAAFAQPYAGVVIDYQALGMELRLPLAVFIQDLADKLHRQNKLLVVIVPPAEYSENGWQTGAYDWRTLGQFADEIVIRSPFDPGSFTAEGQFLAMLNWAAGEVNRYHLSVALSALSVAAAPDSPAILLAVENPDLSAFSADRDTHTPILQDDNQTVWLTTPEALLFRMQTVNALPVGGVLIEDTYASRLDMALVLQNYLTQEGD